MDSKRPIRDLDLGVELSLWLGLISVGNSEDKRIANRRESAYRVYRAGHGFGPEARDRAIASLGAVDADLLRRRA